MAIRPLPRNTSWSERIGKVKQSGKVVDEVYIDEHYKWGDYKKCIQKLQLKNGKTAIRFGYYLKGTKESEKKYRWGSQTTLIMGSKANANRLISKARKKGIL